MNQSRQIVVADDDPADRLLIKTAFEDIGSNVDIIELEDGAETLEFIKNNCAQASPAVIILDINMPKYTGVEVMEFIHKNPTLCKAPVVVFSTSINPDDMSKVLSMGAVKYITKPSDFQGYLALARYVIELIH